MASVSVQIEGKDVPLDAASLKDLGKASSDLKFILSSVKDIDNVLGSMADGALGTLTLDAGNPSWDFGGSPATFSLTAKATAQISIQSKGSLFDYCTDFEGNNKVSIPCQPGKTYIVTKLNFQIDGKLTASAPIGSTGITVKGSDENKAQYTIINYRAFDPSLRCSDALKAAVTGFVLPLHPDTASNLLPGDAISYEFDGSINVGFGFTYGVSTSVGGYSLSELGGAFSKVSGVVNVASKKTMTVGVTAGVATQFNWSRKFNAFLQKTGQISARLHIDAGKDSSRSLQISDQRRSRRANGSNGDGTRRIPYNSSDECHKSQTLGECSSTRQIDL